METGEVKESRIAIGQVWRTRGGAQVYTCARKADAYFPWICSNGISVGADGRELAIGESANDLIKLLFPTLPTLTPAMDMDVPGFEGLASALHMTYWMVVAAEQVRSRSQQPIGESYDALFAMGDTRMGRRVMLNQAIEMIEESHSISTPGAIGALIRAIQFLAIGLDSLKNTYKTSEGQQDD